jgi:prefoldin subunit 5
MINWSWRWRQAEIDALKQGIKALDAHIQTFQSALDAAKSAGRDAQKSAMDWRDALTL